MNPIKQDKQYLKQVKYLSLLLFYYIKGDLGKHLYVILDGSVNVFLPKHKDKIKYEISER